MLLLAHPDAQFVVGNPAAATGPIVLLSDTFRNSPGTVSASFDNPAITGLDWAVWYIPEPSAMGAVLMVGVMFTRKR